MFSGQKTCFAFCSLEQCKAARERAGNQASWSLSQGACSVQQMDIEKDEMEQKEKQAKEVKL